jgi:hypothetical protein
MSRHPHTANQQIAGTSKSAQALKTLVSFPGGTRLRHCPEYYHPEGSYGSLSPPHKRPNHIYVRIYSYLVKHNLISIANQPAHTI